MVNYLMKKKWLLRRRMSVKSTMMGTIFRPYFFFPLLDLGS